MYILIAGFLVAMVWKRVFFFGYLVTMLPDS